MKTHEELKAEINLINAQIEVQEAQRSKLKDQEFHLLYKRMEWNELEEWLKANKTENDYELNPICKSQSQFHMTYCFLNGKGGLQVGAYHHNDRFPRDNWMYVDLNAQWRPKFKW